MRLRLLSSAAILLALSLSGCYFFSDETVEPAIDVASEPPTQSAEPEPLLEDATTVKVEQAPRADSASLADVEVVWSVPEEAVEEYILRYGYQRDSLDSEVRIAASSLEVFNDPEHGRVFRYTIEGVSRTRPVFVSLAGRRGDTISEPTPVFEAMGIDA